MSIGRAELTVKAPASSFVKTIGDGYVILEESDGVTWHRIDGLSTILVRLGRRVLKGEPIGETA